MTPLINYSYIPSSPATPSELVVGTSRHHRRCRSCPHHELLGLLSVRSSQPPIWSAHLWESAIKPARAPLFTTNSYHAAVCACSSDIIARPAITWYCDYTRTARRLQFRVLVPCNDCYFGILTKPYLSHIIHLLMNAFAAVHDGTITAAKKLIPMTLLYPSGCCPSAPKYDAARRTVQR